MENLKGIDFVRDPFALITKHCSTSVIRHYYYET